MAATVKVEFRGQVFEFDKRMKVRELLEKLNLSPESTIVVRGNEVLTEDEWVEEEDEVKVVSAISGFALGSVAAVTQTVGSHQRKRGERK